MALVLILADRACLMFCLLALTLLWLRLWLWLWLWLLCRFLSSQWLYNFFIVFIFIIVSFADRLGGLDFRNDNIASSGQFLAVITYNASYIEEVSSVVGFVRGCR